jgi:hypothetical protein
MTLNGFSQTVRTRISAASADLGGVQQVLDRDEDPAILARSPNLLPACCVVPIGDGKLTSNFAMGSNDMMEDFRQNIVIYYRFSKDNKTPYSDIDTIRGYAKTLINLFSSKDTTSDYCCQFDQGVIYKATVEFHPYQEMDYTLNRMLATLFVKMVEI